MFDAGAQAASMVTTMATTGGDVGPQPDIANTASPADEEGQVSEAAKEEPAAPVVVAVRRVKGSMGSAEGHRCNVT